MSLPVPIPDTVNRQLYQCLSEIIRRASDGTTPLTFSSNLTVVGSVTANNLQGNFNQLIFTVAPSGASSAVKSRADYVGDGVNDHVAIHNAVLAASGSGAYGRVLVLPGNYTFSATCDVSGGYYFFDCRGANITGPGGSADTFFASGGSGSTFNFGTINHSGTGSAIHFQGNLGNATITWQVLNGTSHQGNGVYLDCTTGMSNNTLTGFSVHAFNKGILFGTNSSTRIETNTVNVNFLYDCNWCVYSVYTAGGLIDSNTWNINVDVSTLANAIGVETNGFYDVFNIVLGGLASGAHNMVLDSGAKQNIINPTPLYIAQTANSIVDNSGRTDNSVQVGMLLSLLSGSAANNVVKWGSNTGQLVDSGVAFPIPIASGGTGLTAHTNPTTQVFTSGSGTYTTPAGVKWIKVKLVGGGGAGAGSGGAGVGTGTAGGNTTFGTSLLTGNGGGANNGAGGAATGGHINITGGSGPPGQTAIGFGDAGFTGASSPFGGAGVGAFSGTGGNAQANTGSGGAGGGGTPTVGAGAGGAAGGYLEAIIGGPSSMYSYAIGAGGTGGGAGAGGSAGGNGGSGVIIVEEYYW